MRALIVQIQPGRVGTGDAEKLVATLRAVADGAVLQFTGESRGDDEGPYINVGFAAPDLVTAWARLQAAYDQSDRGRELAASTIAACEGEHGWDDYLLLHHFDPNVQLDKLGC